MSVQVCEMNDFLLLFKKNKKCIFTIKVNAHITYNPL